MTDQIVPPLSAVKPYYDDFEDDKRFLRMLFRPGYSVQARELTQLQTILQKQVDRFGSHVFKNGSIVSGGETFLDKKVIYVQVEDEYADVEIDPTIFVNQKVVDTIDETITGTVVAVSPKTSNGSEPGALVIQLTGSNMFSAGRTLQIPDTSNYITIASTASGSAEGPVGQTSVVRVNEGVFFINGFFVKNLAQTIVLDLYSSKPSYRIGFEINQNIITETSDTSLLDPALETSNGQAPGAARFQIDLALSKRDLDSEDDSQFLELLRVEYGIILRQVRYPEYAQFEDTLARRTFDESGNYTVVPFRLVLREDQGTSISGRSSFSANSPTVQGSNSFYAFEAAAGDIMSVDGNRYTIDVVTDNTSITLTSSALQNANNYVVKIEKDSRYTVQLDPGKAYIKGYEFETVGPTKISSNKARDTATVSGYEINLNYGNYFTANGANGFLDTTTTPFVDLHNVYSSGISTGSYTSTKIGTARVMSVDNNGTDGLFRIHLYDIRFTGNNSFANVGSFSSDNVKHATANVSNYSKIGGYANGYSYLTDTTFNTFIYRFPQSAIAPATITDPSYPTKYSFTSQNFNYASSTGTTGTLSLPTGLNYYGTGTLDSFTTGADFIVVVKDKLSSNLTNGQILTYATNSLRVTVVTPTTATVSAAATAAFVGDIISVVNSTTTTPKTKTLVSANTNILSNTGGFTVGTTRVFPNTAQISLGSSTITNSNVWFSLYLSDVKEANVKIYHGVTTYSDLTDTSKNITSRFSINNGQRDTIYDHARIKLKTGRAAPTGNVVVMADYYTHTGTGYFTVDSYPDANNSSGYTAIPTYTSSVSGSTYTLRDCLDFRVRRIDANTATSSGNLTTTPGYTLENAGLPASETQFVTDEYQYYLSRIDKVIVTRDKIFKVVKGIPSLRPLPPPDDPDGMTLYTLVLPAYTFKATDIVVNYHENKRFTMRDIGNLEKRIQALEYYNALNLLEKNASDMVITDDEGNPRAKYGVLVDSFNGYQIADVGSADIAVSMDVQQGKMYPAINAENLKLDISSATATNANGIIMLPYSTAPFLTQSLATTYEPVAAYAFANWLGTINLYPASDYWYDIDQAPDVVINLNGQNDNWEQFGQLLESVGGELPASQNPFNTVWGNWETIWAGSTVLSETTFDSTTTGANGTTVDTIQRTVTNNQIGQQINGVRTVIQPQTITRSFGDKIVDTSIIPYIRPQKIFFTATNMRPRRPLTAFFDDVDVTAYCQRLNCITLSSDTPGFIASSQSGETITGPGSYSAKVVMSTGKVLYVTNETGTRPQSGNTVVGSTSGSSITISDYAHRTDNVVSSTANTVVLSSHAPTANAAFITNPFIFIVTGTGAGQRRVITAYNGLTANVTVDRNWTTPPDTTSVYSLGYPVVTPSGKIAGIFNLPSSPISFHTGDRVFRLLDTISGAGAISTCTTSADATFYAQGLLQTRQKDIVSIRVPQVVRTSVTDSRVVDNITTVDNVVNSQFFPPPPEPITYNNTTTPIVQDPPQDNYIVGIIFGGSYNDKTEATTVVYTVDGSSVYTYYEAVQDPNSGLYGPGEPLPVSGFGNDTGSYNYGP